MRRLGLFLIALAVLTGAVGVDPGFGQCPEAPAFVLLPSTWQCAVLPACGTQYGVCRGPYAAYSGQPCQCQASNGGWMPGVIIRGSGGR
jgi:hypothetical protein